jgi:hypothetical protein
MEYLSTSHANEPVVPQLVVTKGDVKMQAAGK